MELIVVGGWIVFASVKIRLLTVVLSSTASQYAFGENTVGLHGIGSKKKNIPQLVVAHSEL